MRKHLFLLTLSAILLLSVTWVLAGPPIKMSAPDENKKSEKGQPRLVVPHMEYVFDPVFEGDQIKHDFAIENHGTAPLVIKNVRPG